MTMDWLSKPRQIPRMKAVATTAEHTVVLDYKFEKPRHGPRDVLIKVEAVAITPYDWMKLDKVETPGLVIGCDFAGTIEEIGSLVMPGIRKKGERVAGFLHGGISTYLGGTFGEYCLADAELLSFLPDSVSFEEGAALGISGHTACQTIFTDRPEPNPIEPVETNKPLILVWGASTTIGFYAVQMANLCGYEVIATASPSNHEAIKKLGAAAVFDHSDPEVSQKIKSHTQDKLSLAVDTICAGETPKQIAACFGPNGGTISAAQNIDKVALGLPENVVVQNHLVWTLMGKSFSWPSYHRANEEHHEDGTAYAELLSKMLRKNKMTIHPVKVMPNGLAGINEGLKLSKEGKIRGTKLVYRISDTPQPPREEDVAEKEKTKETGELNPVDVKA